MLFKQWSTLLFLALLAGCAPEESSDASPDNSPPTISLNGASTLFIDENMDFIDPGATAVDDIDGTLNVTVTGEVDTARPGSYQIIYAAQDATGNQASITRTVIVNDITAPVIELIGQNTVAIDIFETYLELGAIATDNVDDTLNITMNGEVDTSVPGTYEIVYEVQDNAGNSNSISRRVFVLDRIAPVIQLIGDTVISVNQFEQYVELGATATDNVDGNVAVTISGEVNTDYANSYELTYYAVDSEDNIATAQRLVNVIDRMPPEIHLEGQQVVYLPLGQAYIEIGVYASDNVDSDIAIVASHDINPHQVGEYQITYMAVDAQGNTTTQFRTVHYQDVEAPTLTLNGDAMLTIELGSAYVELGAVAVDAYEGELTVTTSSNLNSDQIGQYNVDYVAVDSAGNSASITRTISVEDTTPPEITLNGEAEVYVEYPQTYQELSATAIDPINGQLEVSISSEVQPLELGTYEVRYTATDSSGNETNTIRTVHIVDTTAPEITFADSTQELVQYPGFELQIPTDFVIANDNYDEIVTITTDLQFADNNETVTGVVFAATDSSGNTSELIKTVTVSSQRPLILTFKTDNDGFLEDNQLWFGLPELRQSNVYIDWGDESREFLTSTSFQHTYSEVGTYTVKIYGAASNFVDGIKFWESNKLLSVEQWGDIQWQSMSQMFSNCSNLVINATDQPNLANVTHMDGMFAGATNLTGDLSQWDVSSVQYMQGLFTWTTNFESDLSSWDVSNVVDMSYMFRGAEQFNSDLSGWDVANVTNMQSMFDSAKVFDSNLNNWDVSSVENFSNMFNNASHFTGQIYSWQLDAATNLNRILRYNALTTETYDQLLNTFASYDLPSNQAITVYPLQYTDAGAAAHDMLTNNGWTIYDGGKYVSPEKLIAPELVVDGPQTVYLSTGDVYQAFTASATDNIDAEVSVEVSGTVDPTTEGTYEVTYTATDSDGNQTSIVTTFVVLAQRPFITTWQTDLEGETAADQLRIARARSVSGDVYIDWGDGSTEATSTPDLQHTFTTPGTYTVKIWGDLGGIDFVYTNTDIQKLLTIEQWGDIQWQQMVGAFTGAINLQIYATDAPDLSLIDSLERMFFGATSLNADLSHWDVSGITSFEYMFNSASSFNGDVSSWDVSAATNMSFMFSSATSFNQYLGDWTTANVTNMSGMFYGASSFNGDVSAWDVSQVTSMSAMFSGATAFNQNIGNWDVGNVVDLSAMFNQAASFDQDIGLWNVENVISLGWFLNYAGMSPENYSNLLNHWNLTDLGYQLDFDASNVQYLSGAKAARTALIEKGWNINDGGLLATDAELIGPEITLNGNPVIYLTTGNDYHELSAEAVDNIDNNLTVETSGTVDVNTPGTYEIVYTATDTDFNVTTATRTVIVTDQRPFITTWKTDLSGASADEQLTISFSTIDGIYVSWGDGAETFNNSYQLTHTYDVPGTYTVKIWGDLNSFYQLSIGSDAQKLLSIDQWGDIEWTSFNYAFANASNMTILATDVPDLTQVESLMFMFSYATSVNADLSTWDVSNVSNFNSMFEGATAFNGDISTWDMTNATSITRMFYGTSSFNQDLNNWNTSNVTNMVYTFYNASAFDGDISGWDVTSVTSMTGMFNGAVSFNRDISGWNVSYVVDMSEMFSNAASFNADISDWNVANVNNMAYMFFSASAFDQDLGQWQVTKVNDLTHIIYLSGLSTTNYSSMLTNWSQLTVQTDLFLGAGGINYFESAQAARETLLAKGWTIVDAGTVADLIEVVDVTPPEVTLIGDFALFLTLGSEYEELGAVAIDDVDGVIIPIVSGTVDINVVNSYEITYTATDVAGNSSFVVRTVVVLPADSIPDMPDDMTPPSITLNGDQMIFLNVGDSYTELGATATDDVDGEVAVVITGEVDTQTAGRYTVTYTATDSTGNAYSMTRTVFVD